MGPHGALIRPHVRPHAALWCPVGYLSDPMGDTVDNSERETPWGPIGYLFNPLGPHGATNVPHGAPWGTHPTQWDSPSCRMG